MSKFNQLYKTILQSVISQNKASRRALLQKTYADNRLKDDIIDYWESVFAAVNNKTADFICKYIANGNILHSDDRRIKQVIKILKINPSIDTHSYNKSLDQFIQQYKDTVTRYQQKQAAKSIQYLNSVPQFTKYKEYPNGVVIYDVQDSKDGMMAVRKIVDMQWREDANPWCLIARDEEYGYQDSETYYSEDEYVDEDQAVMKDAWEHWKDYDAIPKQIAFQNGKLIAFCANNSNEIAWWDRQDRETYYLRLLDGSFFDTEKGQVL